MPLDNPAVDFPLVLGDRTSFSESDMVPMEHVQQGYLGEFAHPRYKDDQRWYWLNEQKPEEVTIFCIFDSNVPGNTGGKSHQSTTYSKVEA